MKGLQGKTLKYTGNFLKLYREKSYILLRFFLVFSDFTFFAVQNYVFSLYKTLLNTINGELCIFI